MFPRLVPLIGSLVASTNVMAGELDQHDVVSAQLSYENAIEELGGILQGVWTDIVNTTFLQETYQPNPSNVRHELIADWVYSFSVQIENACGPELELFDQRRATEAGALWNSGDGRAAGYLSAMLGGSLESEGDFVIAPARWPVSSTVNYQYATIAAYAAVQVDLLTYQNALNEPQGGRSSKLEHRKQLEASVALSKCLFDVTEDVVDVLPAFVSLQRFEYCWQFVSLADDFLNQDFQESEPARRGAMLFHQLSHHVENLDFSGVAHECERIS